MISLPKISLANLPTPVEPLPRLSAALGGPSLLIKRDDLTGLAFGGNKTRKLEYLVTQAQAQSARTLITAGAVQSNHCRQTAAAAAHFGFDCILVLVGKQPVQMSGNLLLDHLMGAEIIWAEAGQREQQLEQVFENAGDAGRKPYLIPYGGSNPLGAASYAYALEELISQGVSPDWIVVASSSGGTQAGLVVGARALNFTGQILGISVDEPSQVLQARVVDLAGKTAQALGEDLLFSPTQVLVNADYLGEGYGVMGKAELEAIRMFARFEGILVDPVYTGRAAAGLIDLVRRGFFSPEQSVLFWHTGGSPALFADRYQQDLIDG